jgi:hypothetical protein
MVSMGCMRGFFGVKNALVLVAKIHLFLKQIVVFLHFMKIKYRQSSSKFSKLAKIYQVV